MNLRRLRQFVVLAETLNFHRAAERLHMAQPPLSASIRKLEEELGVELFNRDTRGLSITVAGGIVLEHARRTLHSVEELRRSAKECATGAQGRLVLGFASSSSYTVLPNLIPRFQELYPRIELVLHESTTRELIAELAKHTVDVALLRTPLFEECDADLITVENDHFVLAVHPGNVLAQRDSVTLADLADQHLIVYSRARVPAMHAVLMLAFRHAGIAPRVVQEIVQVPTAMGLVETGIGVALVPSATARYVLTTVKLLPITDLPRTLDIGIALAYHRASANGPTQRFVEMATTIFEARAAAAA